MRTDDGRIRFVYVSGFRSIQMMEAHGYSMEPHVAGWKIRRLLCRRVVWRRAARTIRLLVERERLGRSAALRRFLLGPRRRRVSEGASPA